MGSVLLPLHTCSCLVDAVIRCMLCKSKAPRGRSEGSMGSTTVSQQKPSYSCPFSTCQPGAQRAHPGHLADSGGNSSHSTKFLGFKDFCNLE